MESDCIFCKIIAGDVAAQVVMEDDTILVIQDRSPKSNIHYLLIPKVHSKDLQSTTDCTMLCSLMAMARRVSASVPGAEDYRLVINNGYKAGQRVFHLHMHFLSGEQISEI
jgi:histidine triad (HIT) family protein